MRSFYYAKKKNCVSSSRAIYFWVYIRHVYVYNIIYLRCTFICYIIVYVQTPGDPSRVIRVGRKDMCIIIINICTFIRVKAITLRFMITSTVYNNVNCNIYASHAAYT